MMKMTLITGVLAAVAALALPQLGLTQEKSDTGTLFKQLDKSGDGVLTLDEIPKDKMPLFNRLVREGDKNKDGKLSKQEFTAVLSDGERRPRAEGKPTPQSGGGFPGRRGKQPGAGSRPGQRGEGFGQGVPSRQGRGGGGASITPEAILSRFDTNKDGKLTKNEIPQEAQRLQQMLKDADKNRDGVLTKQEITQYLSNAGGQGGRQQPGGAQQPRGQRPGGGRQGARGGGRPNGGAFGANLPTVGQPLPNLTAYSADGAKFKLSNLKGNYSVLVFGCLTWPPFLRNVPSLETVYMDYAPKGVKFYYIYKALAHPGKDGYVRPITLEERLMHVKEAQRTLGTKITWLCDSMSNDIKHALGGAPNSEFIIGPDGKIVVSRSWSSPDELRYDLTKLVGPIESTTRVSDLNLKTEPPPKLAASGVVPRVKISGRIQALKIGPKKGDQPFYTSRGHILRFL